MARTNIADVASMVVLDANGDPVSGGKYRVYEAGTTTDVTLYAEVSGGSTVSNPLIADSAGRIAQAFCDAQKIKISVLDASDVQLAVFDHLDALGASGAVDLTTAQTVTGAKTMDIIGNATGIEDTNDNEILTATATASAVNHVGITNAVTTAAPTIAAAGDDTNVDLKVSGKGTGKVDVIGGLKLDGVAFNPRVLAASYAETATQPTTTNTIATDASIPQSTEGAELMTLTHTRASSTSHLYVDVEVNIGASTAQNLAVWLHQDAAADAARAVAVAAGSNQEVPVARFRYRVASGSTGDTTFKVRYAPTTGTAFINGSGLTNDLFGSAMISSITVTEIEE